ncbi:MAG: hypothetical protein ACLTYW_01140 [Collinsella sp.]
MARVFDGDDGGLMQSFLDLEASDAARTRWWRRLAPPGLFVAGGSMQERTQAKARAIAERFRALADAGQPQGGMVLLLGRMTNADVYARPSATGLDCVIAGGSVFAQAPRCRRCVPWSARSPIRPIRRRALCRCWPRRCLRSAPRSSWRWRPSSTETGRPRAGISTWAS